MPALDESALRELRQRSDALFRTPYNHLPVKVSTDVEPDRVLAIHDDDAGTDAVDPDTTFTIFDHAHQRTALALSRELGGDVDASPDEAGLTAALNRAESSLGRQNSDLVKFALSVFITNHPVGRNLYIPRVVDQSPEKFIPSRPGESPAVVGLGGFGEEAKLDYFREDPDYNGHHEQWHRVYPASESPKDRQGELFWYMHQQMLARYDTERLAMGLPPTAPFADFRELIPEGYGVEAIIADRYRGRDANRTLIPVRFGLGGGQFITLSDLEANRDRLRQFAQQGRITANGQVVDLTPDTEGATLFGALLEASGLAEEQNLLQGKERIYFGIHNMGHGFFSALSAGGPGVMSDTASAVRDPIFYRWHREIDDLFVAWQENLPPNDFAAGAPKVTLRKDAGGQSTDIGLALMRDIAPGVTDGRVFDGAVVGATRFGGANWDTPLADLAQAGNLTDTLETTIKSYTLTIPTTGDEYTVFYIDHAEFAYFFRMENTENASVQITARVFIAPTEKAEDRRNWIEMDKFVVDLEPLEKKVVYQPARLSSVVRKEARRPDEGFPGPDAPNDDYCKCGWPYHMLLPRGTEVGMPFRLMVVLTDAVADLPEAASRCGSVSYCGARDLKYPDNRMMGFPFDRRFGAGGIGGVLADPALPHMAARDFVIRHVAQP